MEQLPQEALKDTTITSVLEIAKTENAKSKSKSTRGRPRTTSQSVSTVSGPTAGSTSTNTTTIPLPPPLPVQKTRAQVDRETVSAVKKIQEQRALNEVVAEPEKQAIIDKIKEYHKQFPGLLGPPPELTVRHEKTFLENKLKEIQTTVASAKKGGSAQLKVDVIRSIWVNFMDLSCKGVDYITGVQPIVPMKPIAEGTAPQLEDTFRELAAKYGHVLPDPTPEVQLGLVTGQLLLEYYKLNTDEKYRETVFRQMNSTVEINEKHKDL